MGYSKMGIIDLDRRMYDMKKVIAIGELLIDFVPHQKGCGLSEVTDFERVAGGAPANVVVAAISLGAAGCMISQVGQDAFGDYIIRTLQQKGVDTQYVFRHKEAKTALAFVSLDASGNREFSFYRNPSADLYLEEGQIKPEIFTDAGVLHFCSVDLVPYPVKEAHRKAIRLARQAGAFISFDPNVRLALWESEAACQRAIQEFLPEADLVKLSDNEIEFVTGCTDERQAAEKLFALGSKVVLITKGGDGSAVYTKTAQAFAKACPVEVVDTTGAGDSFAGAFLYQLIRDGVTAKDLGTQSAEKLQEYLEYASKCSAYTCAHKGAVMPQNLCG